MFYTFFQSKTTFLFYVLLSKTGLGRGSVDVFASRGIHRTSQDWGGKSE